MERKVRVRFAPSPTGPLHIGGVRTALYNYLFAKKHGGDFLLRIEDTDQTRFVPGAEEYIIEAFDWLGIKFDEGQGIGGDYGPYRQSDRKPMYKEYADKLIETCWAYYAFDSPEELDNVRKEFEKEKKNFQYDCNTRAALKNSLSLSKEETNTLLENNTPYVIRFKFPKDTEIIIHDLIRGEVRMNSNLLDDKVLYKSDGMPTYHLANIVDDHLMKISHVIRGEEWLPSCPLHVMLYKAFGWEDTMPKFAHLPLLLKPEGNGKLSKRDGDRLGFPVFPLEWQDPISKETSSGYRETGYFPEAVINILALLGWNSGTEQEIFTLEELIDIFTIERISKSGAKFDLEKAKWFNHQYFQLMPNDKIAEEYLKILKEKGFNASLEFAEKVVSLVKERCSFVQEIWDQSSFFFLRPETYDQKIIKKRWKEDTPQRLGEIADILNSITDFSVETTDQAVHSFIEKNELNMGQIMNCLRLSIVGEGKGPNLFEIICLIGKEETLERINTAIETIGKNE
ncbi:MAG: glutamate--tRNA ligase [Bacteroidales bacterium]|nr:glutamate--tRNA ligase [Bacteroidales bacterium]MDD4683893.1 glutamate--tRNA ligase [Bacteroidales bacterium]